MGEGKGKFDEKLNKLMIFAVEQKVLFELIQQTERDQKIIKQRERKKPIEYLNLITKNPNTQQLLPPVMQLLRKGFCLFSVSKFNASKDYYKILGVTQSSDQKSIKTAFRKLAKQYHPDSTTGNQDKFKQVNQAYQVLSDQPLKKQYDEARTYAHSNHQSRSHQNNYGNPNSYGNPGSSSSYGSSYQSYYNQQQQSSNYRGYSHQTGWQNQRYRQQAMNEIFKQYQRNRSKYGTFQDMYKHNQQNIRQYNDEIKRRQQAVRKAFEAEQIRKEKEWREYQDKNIRDLQQKLQGKVAEMKQGLVKNIHGVLKVGNFLKDTFKTVADTVAKTVAKDDKDDKGKKK